MSVLIAPAPPNPHADALQRVNLLGADLLAAQQRLGITPAVQALQIGVGVTTLTGLTSGITNPVRSTVTSCLRWLANH